MDLPPDNASYLHDAYVHTISLSIGAEGERRLVLHVHCHPDCGFEEWNDCKLQIEFVEPLIVYGELLGHMANAEEINAVDLIATDRMSRGIKRLTDTGIAPPAIVASVTFQSGSQLDVACQTIRVLPRQVR